MISTVLRPARFASSVALAAALEAGEPSRKSPRASRPNLLRLEASPRVCLPSYTPLRLSPVVALNRHNQNMLLPKSPTVRELSEMPVIRQPAERGRGSAQ
jgi:hypothetical protein